ncbi:hypothetical protein MCOR25_010958 [Pyricularia grisea]|nr:hypothetical protein MCOR25_010958 [Pyricularia grisea]
MSQVSVTVIKETDSNFTLGERVEQLTLLLLQIVAYHKDRHAQSGIRFRPKKGLRHQLEGFDFRDVATKQDTISPKVATLKCRGWTDFANTIHAVPLFGVGFGELLKPVTTEGSAACCISTKSVPAGSDFLAAYGADLHALRKELEMEPQENPWEIAVDTYWHSPEGVAFTSCVCKNQTTQMRANQRTAITSGIIKGMDVAINGLFRRRANNPADRAQVLLSATFKRLFTPGLTSPSHIVLTGAVIFGHSWKFPLRWERQRDSPPNYGEPDFADEDDSLEIAATLVDRGIGAGVSSSSSADLLSPDGSSIGGNASSSPSSAPTSLYSMKQNPIFSVDGNSYPSSTISSAGQRADPVSSPKRSLGESQTGDAENEVADSRKLRRVSRGLGRKDPDAPESE